MQLEKNAINFVHPSSLGLLKKIEAVIILKQLVFPRTVNSKCTRVDQSICIRAGESVSSMRDGFISEIIISSKT